MSNGLIPHLPGSYRMGGDPGLPDAPWLLPISDRAAPAAPSPEALMQAVRLSSRPFRIAANTLGAALALLLTVQVVADWRGAAPPASNQVAQALPPTLAAERASLGSEP